jgi:hypothetical protein
MPFPLCRARPGAKPLEPFGKGSNALKAGTPDAGPCRPYRASRTRPSVQPPAGVERKAALYAGWARKCKSGPALRARTTLNELGKPNRKFNAFAELLGVRIGLSASFLYPGEQDLKVVLEQLLPKAEVAPRACKVGIGNRRKLAHVANSQTIRLGHSIGCTHYSNPWLLLSYWARPLTCPPAG